MSFTRFVEHKHRPAISLSYDHYREVMERDVYDTLLDPIERSECFLTHLTEAMDLRHNLEKIGYPKREELLMAVASREPVKIRRAHEQFNYWNKRKDAPEASFIDSALFECRAYLYGKEVRFSKEMANKLVETAFLETEKNVSEIASLVEKAVQRVSNWHGSSVIFKVLKPDSSWVSQEGMIIIGQPPSMTFMCKRTKPKCLEIYDIQDIEGYPLSVQEDYANLIRSLQVVKPATTFQTWYFLARPSERPRFERLKREVSLGMETSLPGGTTLKESLPDCFDMDVWKVKMKTTLTEVSEAPIRWLDLIRKAEDYEE